METNYYSELAQILAEAEQLKQKFQKYALDRAISESNTFKVGENALELFYSALNSLLCDEYLRKISK